MPDFKILDVFADNARLVVRAEHYNADGSVWFTEHYRWQGREGLKRKRQTNSDGGYIMDDGNVAPLMPVDVVNGIAEPYLPDGRTWARYDIPYMDEGSILGTIRSTHDDRLVSGWPQGSVDVMSPTGQAQDRDEAGISTLVSLFSSLKDREV